MPDGAHDTHGAKGSIGAVGAVDCGTNSTRLLIADTSGKSLDRRMRITRLGAGVDATLRLDPSAVRRTLHVLEEYKKAMDERGVTRLRASATSATRDAENSADFLEAAAEILGETPRVLSGSEEGTLSYRGATRELEAGDGPFLVVDVGGGSTELVTSAGGSITAVSLDVGCVRVTERFLRSDPPTQPERSQAAKYVGALVERAAEKHPELAAAKLMVGLAGTVSALARLALGLDEYDRDRVHHARLSRAKTRELLDDLAGQPYAERRERRGMEKERADVIVGGALVLVTVMDVLGHEEFLVSESDILDGMIESLLQRAGQE